MSSKDQSREECRSTSSMSACLPECTHDPECLEYTDWPTNSTTDISFEFLIQRITNEILTSAVKLRWLENNYSHSFLGGLGILISKVGQTDLVFGVRSGFISRCVHARLQVSVCSSYNLCHYGRDHKICFFTL